MYNLFTFSEAGGYSDNEDAYLALPHQHDDAVLICALADGQGGRPGAALAAREACAMVVEAANTYTPKQLTKTRNWLKILGEADKAVHREPRAGFTTLIGLCLSNDVICGASNGDSEAVLLNTYDQYHDLTAGQSKNPPIGSGQAQATVFSEHLVDPWLTMISSDGLWKFVGRDRVKTLLKRKRGEVLLKALTYEARLVGGGTYRDDTTLILVESVSGEQPV